VVEEAGGDGWGVVVEAELPAPELRHRASPAARSWITPVMLASHIAKVVSERQMNWPLEVHCPGEVYVCRGWGMAATSDTRGRSIEKIIVIFACVVMYNCWVVRFDRIVLRDTMV
jgi:hypothetical protein